MRRGFDVAAEIFSPRDDAPERVGSALTLTGYCSTLAVSVDRDRG